jgi:predicted RNase H-like HicB family nuclease
MLMLTAVFVEGKDGYILAYTEELPGAFAQGDTIEDAAAHLATAVMMRVQDQRRTNRDCFAGMRILKREQIAVEVGNAREPLHKDLWAGYVSAADDQRVVQLIGSLGSRLDERRSGLP